MGDHGNFEIVHNVFYSHDVLISNVDTYCTQPPLLLQPISQILCPLSANQIFWYKGFLMNEIEALIKVSEDSDGNSIGKNQMLRNLVMQLRKCCLHPYLYEFAERDIDKTSVEELIATSGKLAVLDKVLRSMFKKGNRTGTFLEWDTMVISKLSTMYFTRMLF